MNDGIAGKWRIAAMDLSEQEALTSLALPSSSSARGDPVSSDPSPWTVGWIACTRERNGRLYVEFTWDGNEECDPASGRGWTRLQKGGCLRGRIYIHAGDDSGFKAIRFEEETTCGEAAMRRKL
jgi:hypothetical protein